MNIYVNLNFRPDIYQGILPVDPPARPHTVGTLNNQIPQEWVDAEFCDANGRLLFSDNILEEFDDALIKPVFNKKVKIGELEVRLGKYLKQLLEILSPYSVRLYLRGSYATHLAGIDKQLNLLIDHFTKLHPKKKPLMEAGLARLNLQPILQEQLDDIDFAICFSGSIDKVDWIKDQLVRLNSELGKIPPFEAKAESFKTLLRTQKNVWCSLEDQIVIASLHGEAKVDFSIGHMEVAPYLFTRDNHAIVRKKDKWCFGAVEGFVTA